MKRLLLFLFMLIVSCLGPAARAQTVTTLPLQPALRQAVSPPPAQPPVSPPLPYWQQEVNYTIDVTLNDIEHTLDGFIRIQYTNHSPDSLSFLWIHLWPNACKNDQTAFSDQLLGNGRTDFYFSDKEARGYINRLDFRVDGIAARTEDHPQYIDIVKVILPHPLPPDAQITLTTPFHEKLPFNFSRGGHTGRSYQLTQWYPKPAVYDRTGWHPMPYLDQGGFYSDYGRFDVHITLPVDYVVAATGERQPSPGSAASAETTPALKSSEINQTLYYRQDHIHDFAWFADKRFHTDHDTMALPSGRIIDVYACYTPEGAGLWRNSIRYMKEAVRFLSSSVGEYPFNTVSAVEAKMGSEGGMEYPTITSINPQRSPRALAMVIQREIGHNWFYAVLGTNERRYPWMDEGINTYYERRYEALTYPPGSSVEGPVKTILPVRPSAKPHPASKTKHAPPPGSSRSAGSSSPKISPRSRIPNPIPKKIPNPIRRKIPANPQLLYIETAAAERTDQPISTASEDFTPANYDLIAYAKTGLWMKELEDSLGTPLFDSCMQEYFRRWQFKHPSPEDFRSVIESASHRQLAAQFARLDQRGPLPTFPSHRKIRPAFLFSTHEADKINYINILPAIGYNKYDQFMIGALIHNYNLPPSHFQFILAPLYATNSHQLDGIGRIAYTWHPGAHTDNHSENHTGSPVGSHSGSQALNLSENPTDPRSSNLTAPHPGDRSHSNSSIQNIEIAFGAARFSSISATDSNGSKLFGGFYKFTPSARLTFRNPEPRSTMQKWIEWKTFLIGEKSFTNYVLKTSDSSYYPTPGTYAFRYLNQFSLNIQDNRVLYPYRGLLQFQQAASFIRIDFTGNYFFNYARGGGLNLRLFAARFGYIGGRDPSQDLSAYEPKLTAVRGNEDYTYSDYFIGRSEYTGFSSQQIMMRDGGLKIRTDLFQGLQGRSDNWIAALNLNSTLPASIVPAWLPLKVFLDIGTYAEGWQDNAPTSRFLFVGGFQLSLVHNIINFYAPLLYSSDFRDQLKTLPDENTFFKKLSFTIELQNINYRKLLSNLPL